MAVSEPTNWDDFRACTVCHAATGQACRSRSGRLVEGRPDGVATALPEPHTLRKRRAGR